MGLTWRIYARDARRYWELKRKAGQVSQTNPAVFPGHLAPHHDGFGDDLEKIIAKARKAAKHGQ
jgi:hypothetical protein